MPQSSVDYITELIRVAELAAEDASRADYSRALSRIQIVKEYAMRVETYLLREQRYKQEVEYGEE